LNKAKEYFEKSINIEVDCDNPVVFNNYALFLELNLNMKKKAAKYYKHGLRSATHHQYFTRKPIMGTEKGVSTEQTVQLILKLLPVLHNAKDEQTFIKLKKYWEALLLTDPSNGLFHCLYARTLKNGFSCKYNELIQIHYQFATIFFTQSPWPGFSVSDVVEEYSRFQIILEETRQLKKKFEREIKKKRRRIYKK